MSSALEYWVWLGAAFGSGNGRTDEIIRRFESLEDFYSTGGYREISQITKAETERLLATKLDDAKRIAEQMHHRGITILTPDDVRYPTRLRNIYGMPCVLYVDGELGDIDNELTIAMVGTRRCSDYGYRAANKIGSELAQAGVVIVSGLASGIDTVCHTAAVKQDRRTIAVLGCGIDKTYPTQNKTLRELIAKNGAVVSEFAPGTTPYAGNFPIRNRIISGLSMGVVVVEAGERSGSLITAHVALDQGKDVFAVPNDIFNDSARGTFALLRQGAIPVSCGLDVLEEYRYRFAKSLSLERLQPVNEPQAIPQPAVIQTSLLEKPLKKQVQGAVERAPKADPEGISSDALLVYHLLTDVPIQMEEISKKLQKSIHEVLTALTELEIMGLASAQSGKRYKRM
ncbi:DNA-processing protein DprA [Hydrogenoanaerobacterium sp.]|uniref:DNA-processing protein DprA n=1 Tax=Hydrogenoanaerobacterium sp. TaxID=2953763 RepID=UPI00289B142C|nr:DNA-processing protein DprA [Hydrogenoanaerobacterium sp.]